MREAAAARGLMVRHHHRPNRQFASHILGRRHRSQPQNLGLLHQALSLRDMKLHRAVTLVAMMVLSVLLLGMMMISAVDSIDGRSLIALIVVVAAAAAGGIGFSWKRYYRR